MNDLSHIAIIMDGNGRWAKSLGKERTYGHYMGVKNVRNIAIHANERGIKYLTLYAFSTENWKRPEKEVSYLMSLPKVFFASYLKELMEKDIKVTMIGKLDSLPKEAKDIFVSAIEKTKDNKGMVLCFALNYGSRDEIIRAAKKYALDLNKGIDIEKEEDFNKYLDTYDMPDVDLMIRTSGEERLSNFLLYQLAYAELLFVEKAWPEFDEEEFDKCIKEYEKRNRRYGAVDEN